MGLIVDNWLENGNGKEMFFLQDPLWFRSRPQTSGDLVLAELDRNLGSQTIIEVQKMGKFTAEPGVKNKHLFIPEIRAHFDDYSPLDNYNPALVSQHTTSQLEMAYGLSPRTGTIMEE